MSVLKSLTLVAVTTIGLLILDHFFALRHVTLSIWSRSSSRRRNWESCRRSSQQLRAAARQRSSSIRRSTAFWSRPATSDRAPALRLRRDRHRPLGDQSQATGRSRAAPRNRSARSLRVLASARRGPHAERYLHSYSRTPGFDHRPSNDPVRNRTAGRARRRFVRRGEGTRRVKRATEAVVEAARDQPAQCRRGR